MTNITNKSIITDNIIASSNAIIQSTLDRIAHQSFLKVDFNSDLKDKDAQTCHEALVTHRFLKKYIIPSGESTSALREVCFNQYLEYDNHLPTEIKLWSEGYEYYILRKARSLLSTWLRNCTIGTDLECEFTPGESFISQRGDVSIIAKLQNKNHWTTTWNLLDDTCHLIYHTLSLKRIAKFHIGRVSTAERKKLFVRFGNKPNSGFLIFRELLLSRVLIVVDGARASSVPKNNETDRFINVETTFGCLLQRTISRAFLSVLKTVGNSLDVVSVGGVLDMTYDAQEIHKRMIANRDYATIDFSNASDSVSTCGIQTMYPVHISSKLFQYRSHYVKVGEAWVEPLKLSSMGNGFTFETMTLLLLSVARSLDPTSRVFGDDVIIKNDVAETFIKCCNILGFNINRKKTFINSRFRESCGSFYHDDVGYILSFDIKYVTNPVEFIATCNKVYLIYKSLPIGRLKYYFYLMHEELMQICPASNLGPAQPHIDSRYVYCDRYLRRRKNNLTSRKQFSKHVNALNKVSTILQLEKPLNCVFIEPHFKQSVFKADPRVVWAATLYSMRVPKRTIRNRGTWVDKTYVTSECGVTMSMRNVYEIIRSLQPG